MVSSPASKVQEDVDQESQEISDPFSVDGQNAGALLKIMRTATVVIDKSPLIIQPGELVRTIMPYRNTKSGDGIWSVLHITSSHSIRLPRTTFFPFGSREICSCPGYRCRCVYEDFPSSLAFHQSVETQICSPTTAEGLKPGAIFRIYQKPQGSILIGAGRLFHVGDTIEFTGPFLDNSNVIEARNLRTSENGNVPWAALSAVGVREVCDCKGKLFRCSCVYVDYQKSMEFDKIKTEDDLGPRIVGSASKGLGMKGSPR